MPVKLWDTINLVLTIYIFCILLTYKDPRKKQPLKTFWTFNHGYVTLIEKHFLVTCTNLSQFFFLATIPVLVPNVWANGQSQSWHPLLALNLGPCDCESDALPHHLYGEGFWKIFRKAENCWWNFLLFQQRFLSFWKTIWSNLSHIKYDFRKCFQYCQVGQVFVILFINNQYAD